MVQEEINWNMMPKIEKAAPIGGVEYSSGVPESSDFVDVIDESSVTLTNYWDEMQRFPTHPSGQIWDLPSPEKTSLPPPPIPAYSPCQIWQKANTIYARIYQFDQQRVYDTDKVNPGSLVKVVKDGWGSLSFQEKNNPVLQILRDVDQHLFWHLDPITKIANLYKSFLLLKVSSDHGPLVAL